LRFVENGQHFDLVLLDYLMPEMDGEELAQKLHGRNPDLRLVAVSAVGKLPASFTRYTQAQIQKGEDPEQFLAKIAAVLTDRVEPAANRTQTVLCVDDEEAQLKARKAILEDAGFRVLTARSARAAMDLFSADAIDAVILDYWLSGRNGSQLAEEMKRLRPRTPVIMLSSFAALPGENILVDAWLRKGDVEPDQLVAEVQRLIELRQPRNTSK
jgi:DNA-binding NtrC family response regulator